MNNIKGNSRAVIQDNIRFSEQTLQRLHECQSRHENARNLLVTAFDSPFKLEQPKRQPQRTPLSLVELSDNVNCLQWQVKNCLAELDTERTVRCDGVREVQQVFSNEVGELRAMCLQLKKENAYLGETVRSLEKRLLLSSVTPTTDMHRQPTTTTTTTANANAFHTAAIPPFSYPSSDLVRRVEELESTVVRQRRLIEDRQTHLDGVLREVVNVKIDTEMERMRTVARDAARACTEDLVRLRLSSMQSTLSAELQKMMEFVTSVGRGNGNNMNNNNKSSNGSGSSNTGESSPSTEVQLRQVKEDVLRRVGDVDAAVTVLSNTAQRHECDIRAAEDRVAQRVAALERELSAARCEMRDGVAKCTQASEARAAGEMLQLQSTVTERLLDVCQSAMVRKEDAASMHDRLQQQITALRDQLTGLRETQNATAQTERRGATEIGERLENLQHTWETSQLQLQQDITRVGQQLRAVQSEVDQWKPRLRDALTAGEEARAGVQESVARVQSIEANTHEGLARNQAQLQRCRAEQESTAAMVRQLAVRMTAIEELRHTVQDVCMPKLMELGRVSLELQARSNEEQQQDRGEDISRQAEGGIQQVSVLRCEVETGLRSLEDRLLTTLRDGQMGNRTAIESLKSCIDEVTATVSSHEKLFARKSVVDTAAVEIADLAEKLQRVESAVDVVSRRTVAVAQQREQEKEKEEKDKSTEIDRVLNHTESALEALRHRMTEVERISSRSAANAQQQQQQQREEIQQLETRLQQEAERVTQLLYRMREEYSTELHKVRMTVEEDNEQRCRRIEDACQGGLQRQQQQLERIREVTNAARVVGAITDDAGLLHIIGESLRDVFAQREDTTATLSLLSRKIDRQQQQLTEIDGRYNAHEHDWTHRLQTHESSQRDYVTRVVDLEQQLRHAIEECRTRCCTVEGKLTSLEAQQQTTAELNKRWREGNRVDCKRDAELLTEHLDERVSAVQSIAAAAELQSRTLQLSVKELQQQYTALRKELDKTTLSNRERRDYQEKSLDSSSRSSSSRSSSGSRESRDDHHYHHNKWTEELYGRIAALEDRVELAAQTTADTLSGLQEGIQACVTLFVQEVSSSELLQHAPADTPEWRAVADVRGLDGVLLFLWERLCGLYDTAQALQDGTLGTLDLLQQHEERLFLLKPIRSLVVRIAGRIADMEEVIGMPHVLDIDPQLLDPSECDTE